jgi:hypothetical protein
VYKVRWTNVIDFFPDVYCMNKFKKTNQAEGLVNQNVNLPKSMRRTTTYAFMAATVILLLVVSVPIIHPVAAQSDGSTFGERHTTLCGIGPGILGGTGHPFLSMGLKAICSSS